MMNETSPLTLRPVTRDHVDTLVKLKVGAHQPGLVADNVKTLAQAAYEPNSTVWGLWSGETAVGLMAMIDFVGYPHLFEGEDPNSAYLWRLMIDHAQQGKGFGRQALTLARDVAKGWQRPRLYASVADVPHSNLGFYLKNGFRETGRIFDGERDIVCDL
jgi:diamine N-acetyltransferase